MPFTDYTQPSSVRAVLGISVKEVSDDVVQDVTHLTELLEKLYEISPSLSDDYLVAKSASTRTALQTRFVLLVETFSAYLVASRLIPSLSLAAPMIITDGKTAITRVSDPMKELKQNIDASLLTFLARLQKVYALVNPAYSAPVPKPRTLVGSVGTDFDNVTGT